VFVGAGGAAGGGLCGPGTWMTHDMTPLSRQTGGRRVPPSILLFFPDHKA
jgi:hypothetical protein